VSPGLVLHRLHVFFGSLVNCLACVSTGAEMSKARKAKGG
jgi:hypothetical protein